MALDPLKFQVAIQDDVTRELTKIEQEFEKLKDKTINVKVEGLQDLRNLLSALQHKQVETLGKDVASGLHEAAKGLQEEAQKAVRASLSSLAQDLATVKSAIQNDNFSAFSTRILKCTEAVNTLDEAFKKFHITIGSDAGMKNFMTGLGEVIRNVRTTMVQLNGIRSGGMNTITEPGINKANLKNIDDWAESVRKANVEATKLETEIRRLQDIESRAKLNGIDTSHITAKIAELQNNLNTLRSIGNSASVSNSSRLSNEEAAAIRRAVQEKEKAVGATRQLSSEEQRLAQALNHTTESARGQSQVLSDLKSMATQYLGVWGGQQFLHNIIEIGGQLEMQRLSIGAILGDMAKANDLFGRIKDLAVKSPFGVVELDSMTKQLSAYGFEYKELFDMTKRLADISAATGTDVGRLALALGHVRSEAALSGYTLRQFSMANIPLAKKLSEQLSEVEGKLVSVADVRKRVRNKEIGYDEVLDVIKDLTDEGGMFYNAQEVMSESVKAKFKNLKDSMDIMYGDIAESSVVGGGLKEVAAMLTSLTRHWQELGAVLLTVGGYWTIQKVSMMACNKAATEGNLVMGRFTAKQLEMQATTGNLSRKLLLQAVATKKLAVADAEAAGAALGLSRAQLQHVANTGKIVSATNMASLATSKYTVAQLRLMATFRNASWLSWGKWLSGIKLGFAGAVGGVKSLTFAVGGLVRSFWPLLAVSAVVEIFTSMSRKAEEFAEAANYAGQSARSMMKDIDEAINSATTGGKPTDTTALRESVKTMKDVLEQNEFYTDEQQKQVDAATSLSAKYDILLKQLREMREEASWQADNEDLIKYLLESTSHSVITSQSPHSGVSRHFDLFGFGNNSLSANIAEVTKANGELSTTISMLSEYQGVMQEAIKKNNGFGLSLEGKSWQEQIRMIAESGNWEKFISSVEHAGNHFEDKAKNVEKASKKVRDSWDKIANDDADAIRLALAKRFNMTEKDVMEFAKNNQDVIKWMVDGITKSLKIADVNIAEGLKQLLYNFFGISGGKKAEMRTPTVYDQQTDLGRKIVGNVIKYNKKNGKSGNGHITVKEANELAGTIDNPKTESEAVKAIKERAQKDLQTMRDTKKIYGKTSKEYQAAKKKYEHDLNIAKANRITEDEIDTKKGKKTRSGSKADKELEMWRKRIQLLEKYRQELAQLEKLMTRGQAEAKLKSEGDFAPLWKYFSNPNDYKGSLDYVAKRLGTKGDRKSFVDELGAKKSAEDLRVFKENVANAVSELDRLANVMAENYDTYKKWVDLTGDSNLAATIAGVTQNSSMAGWLTDKMSGELGKAGEKRSAQEVFGLSESEVKKFGENSAIYKLWNEWQENNKKIKKQNLDLYEEAIKNAKGYSERVADINRELEKEIAAIKEMTGGDNPTEEQQTQRDTLIKNATDNANKKIADETWKNFKATEEWGRIFADLDRISTGTLERMLAKLRQIAPTLNDSVESTKAVYEAIDRVQNVVNGRNPLRAISESLSKRKALGGYYKQAQQKGDLVANAELSKLLGVKLGSTVTKDQIKDGMKNESENFKKAIGKVVDGLQTFQNGLNFVSGVFDSLGMAGASNVAADASNILGGAMQGASALSALGPWGMAAGAGLGLIGGIAQTHDARLERQIAKLREDVQKIENNTALIVQARERTLGYDNGDVRRSYAQMYAPDDKQKEDTKAYWTTTQNGTVAKVPVPAYKREGFKSQAQKDMYEYYSKNSSGTGYQQEYQNLLQQRKDYMDILSAQEGKKKKSQSDIEETQKKIAELNDQIMYFTQDLAKELWNIDIKGWADQISDALMSAFENGGNAMKAFEDVSKSIMQSVAKEILKIAIIEPFFQNLQDTLFGKLDPKTGERVGGIVDVDEALKDPASYGRKVADFTANFLKGAQEAMVTAGSELYYSMENVMNQLGWSLGNDSANTLSASVQGTSEETSSLLAAYLNAARQDISVNRILLTQFVTQLWPEYVESFAKHVSTVANINVNVQLMMEMMRDGSGALFNEVSSMRSRFDNVVDGIEKLAIR